MNKLQLFQRNFLSLLAFWFCDSIARMRGNTCVCRILEFTPPLDGHALVNHVIRNISLDKQDQCRVACYLNNDCLSYNFGRHADGRFVCQLSDSEPIQNSYNLKKSSGFIYRGTENACSKNLCSPHGKCKIDPKDNTYYCKCKHGFVGKYCDEAFWVKINTDRVCFGARDNKYGSFTILQEGSLGALKLVHLSGTLVCFNGSPPSYWGCISPTYGNKTLMTFISHPNLNERSILLPRIGLTQMGGPWPGCKKDVTYELDGFNDVSPEIIFNTLSDPLQVALNQQFWIWFGQDMADCTERNNDGQCCVDVYGWYIS